MSDETHFMVPLKWTRRYYRRIDRESLDIHARGSGERIDCDTMPSQDPDDLRIGRRYRVSRGRNHVESRFESLENRHSYRTKSSCSTNSLRDTRLCFCRIACLLEILGDDGD